MGGKKQCFDCTLQVGVYQIIKMENGLSVEGTRELGGARLYKSPVSAHSSWTLHLFALRNVTAHIFIPDVGVRASRWLKSAYFLCMTAAEWDCFGSVTTPTTEALLPMSRFYWPPMWLPLCVCVFGEAINPVSMSLSSRENPTSTFFFLLLKQRTSTPPSVQQSCKLKLTSELSNHRLICINVGELHLFIQSCSSPFNKEKKNQV